MFSETKKMMDNKKPKLAIIVSHPIQYLSPVYQLIGKSDQIDLIVFYYSDAGANKHLDRDFGVKYNWDINLLDGYRSEILKPNESVSGIGFWEMDSPVLTEHLNKENPEAVLVNGYASRLQWRAWNWARKSNKKLLYFSDSIIKGYQRSIWKKIIKSVPVRLFFKDIDIFLAIGDNNIKYLKHFGATVSQIVRCPLSVDIKRFQAIQPEDILFLRQSLRLQYKIDQDAFVVLFSGKFIPRKRPMDLLKASIALRKSGKNVIAVFLGSGKLINTLKAEIELSNMPESAHFLGFVNQQDIVRIQYIADAFAITSEKDAHPLVVTEAAACGLPIISSDRVGCVGPTDTVQEGINAVVYPCGDIDALKNSIEKLMESPQKRKKMSQYSLQIASTQDISVAAAVIEKTVLELCQRSKSLS